MLVFKKHEIGFHFWCVCVCMHTQLYSLVRPFATSWTIVPQYPLSMGLSRQEYWRVLPLPTKRDIPNPIILSQTFVGQVREDELEQTLNNLFCFAFSMLMQTIYLIYEVTDIQRN